MEYCVLGSWKLRSRPGRRCYSEMVLLQDSRSVGLLVRTAWTLGLLTTTLFSVLLIGCHRGEVLNPSESQGLELLCLFIYLFPGTK